MPELVMPHAVRQETDANFKARVLRQMHRKSEYGDTAVFRLGDVNYVVGSEAVKRGSGDRLTGPAKYKKGYLDVLMLAVLQKLLPDGHGNLIVGCAHTTKSIPYIEAIADAIGGKHVITRYDNTEITYNVRAFVPWDEPAGGLLRFMTRPYAEYNEYDITPGQRILVVDIGGKISSMYPAIVLPGMKLQILWNDGDSFDLGIQDIESTLVEEMTDLYPDTFQVRRIPQTILREALERGGMTTVRNRAFDAVQAVVNATSPLISQIQKVYSNQLDGGLDINHTVITGGGGGLLFKTLMDRVFGNEFVYLADDPGTINLANLRGGKYAMTVWATENAHRLKAKNGNAPIIMTFDPGNSDLKADIMETSSYA